MKQSEKVETVVEVEGADETFCPFNAALKVLMGRWTLQVIRSLLEGPKRFNGIARECGVNPRTLTDRLRELEREGLVARIVLSQMPPSVEYSLTEKGRALNEVFESIADWGRAWMPAPNAQQD